ncbi:MAG: hypothetical protein ABII82_15510 [Verrucomicrobiota bacterium]
MPRLPLLLALGALALQPAHASAPAADPWQDALTFDYNAAAERFAELHDAKPDDTRVAIAYASALLVRQPRTESNIRDAHDLLLNAARTSSPHTSLAIYLLARIELDHLTPAQPDTARARLEQLRRDHPAHPLADQAAVELAYLAAYPEDASPDAIAKVEALLPTVTAPGARRDLHALLAHLQLRRARAPAAALPHLVAAREIGYELPLRNADADLGIANIARDTGDTALAHRHYAAFIAAAPRDTRASTVRRLLAELPSAP